jgi:TetR/AcrR family transcriptional regulator, fatty acid metabolism regulator protein
MTKPPPRSTVFRLPRERRVADIMYAARTVFEDKGYDAALISEIAERAQVVEGTIYRYFENKRALLTKVVEHWYAGMLSDYDHELHHIRGTRDRLRFLIWKHLVTVHDEPALCRLVFQVEHTWAYLRGEGDFSPDDAADAITELVYRGLAKPASPRRGSAHAVRVAKVTRRLERLAAGKTGELA